MPRRSLAPAALLVPAALFAWGAALTWNLWGRTGDISGDFGHELYIAWQLSRGQIFGRDLAYLYGPLSPWINAAAMRLFGPRLDVILATNLLLLCLTTILLYKLLIAATTRLAAFTATAFFLAVFALSSGTRITNYNFLTPYAQGVTHGLLLCLATAACLARFHRNGRAAWIYLAGFLTGAAVLTKPEISLACTILFLAGVLAAVHLRAQKDSAVIILIAIVSLAAAPLLAWIGLCTLTPVSSADAFKAAMNGWLVLSQPDVTRSPFNRAGMGIDNIPNSLGRIALSTAVDLAALAVICILAMITRRRAAAWVVGALSAIALCAATIFAGGRFNTYWPDADRALILFALAAAVFTTRRLVTSPAADAHRRFVQWLLAILSLALLPKMFLNVRSYQYGFVLVAPIFVVLIIAIVDFLPAAVARAGGSATVARLAAIGLLAGLMINRLVLTQQILGERTLPIPLATGGNLYGTSRDEPIAVAINWLRQTPPKMTVAVYPDAAGIDFAAARASGLPYNVLNPMTTSIWQEDRILASARRHPPDLILLLHTDTSGLGARFFGFDYAKKLGVWVHANYTVINSLGPPTGPRVIQLWQRDFSITP